jgi:tetratricopeptide (TPR) repeat protein
MQNFQQWILVVRQHKAIAIVLLLYGLVILMTFQEYGITNDEVLHVEHGEALMDWFSSFGQEDRVTKIKGTYLYGGLFDTVGELAIRISPLDPYETKHLCNALVGMLGIIAAYRIGLLFGGEPAGLLAAILLILTPRYHGHAFNNPKDIPFAVFYLWSIYYLIRGIGELPHLSRSLIIKTGLAIGLTLAIRVGGILLIAYLGLFYALTEILLHEAHTRWRSALFAFCKRIAAIGGIAYGFMILFWPYALANPINGPLRAFGRFSDFREEHYSYFGGELTSSLEIPRTYIPKWLTMTLPEHTFLGLAAGIVVILLLYRKQWRTVPGLQIGLLVFCSLFPILFIVARKPPLYDEMRHLLFAVPPLPVLAGIATVSTFRWLTNRAARLTLAGVSVCCVGLAMAEMIRLHPNEVVYFNHLFAGSVDNASQEFETDYWRNSQKQGIRWIEEHHGAGFTKRIKISSLLGGNIHQIDSTRMIHVDYWQEPDFYIGNTRYDHHKIIPGEILHTIRGGETDLLYIVRPDDAYSHLPFFTDSEYAATYRRRIYKRSAKELLQRGYHLRAAKAYLGLATSHEALGSPEEARSARLSAIALFESPAEANNHAAEYISQKHFGHAKQLLLGLTSSYPDRPGYLTNLVVSLINLSEYDFARTRCQDLLRISPDKPEPYLLQIMVEMESGELAQAERALKLAAVRFPELDQLSHFQATSGVEKAGRSAALTRAKEPGRPLDQVEFLVTTVVVESRSERGCEDQKIAEANISAPIEIRIRTKRWIPLGCTKGHCENQEIRESRRPITVKISHRPCRRANGQAW